MGLISLTAEAETLLVRLEIAERRVAAATRFDYPDGWTIERNYEAWNVSGHGLRTETGLRDTRLTVYSESRAFNEEDGLQMFDFPTLDAAEAALAAWRARETA